jgi:hypothetical protein
MYDLRDVLVYLAQRVGLIPGRVWFGGGMAVNVSITAKQRRNFLRFLNRHGLKRYLVLDDFHRRPELTCAAPEGRCRPWWVRQQIFLTGYTTHRTTDPAGCCD